MLKKLNYLYNKFVSEITYFDVLTVVVVALAANAWYSLIALFFVTLMQLFQLYSTINHKALKPKLAFYSGVRKIILRFCVMFCMGVAFKTMYIVAFSTVDTQTKYKLLSEIIIGFIIMPYFSDWLIKYDTTRKI